MQGPPRGGFFLALREHSGAIARSRSKRDIGGVSWLSTDDNLVLEYSTPRANVNDGEKTFKANRTLLVGFR